MRYANICLRVRKVGVASGKGGDAHLPRSPEARESFEPDTCGAVMGHANIERKEVHTTMIGRRGGELERLCKNLFLSLPLKPTAVSADTVVP